MSILAPPYSWTRIQPQTLAHLEVRLARHAQTQVTFKDGTHIVEPASVEGYLYRIKPGSQSRSIIYLSSHDGSLFLMPLSISYLRLTPDDKLTRFIS